MEKFNFAYSQKCIPIPPQNTYKKILLAKTEDFLQTLRGKTFLFLNPDENKNVKETYGFRIQKTAPQIPKLASFKKDLADMIGDIKFTNFQINYQLDLELKKKVKQVQNSDKALINADKTSNRL